MNNPFKIIAGYLERGDTEVEGRGLEQPPPAIQSKLREFARGTLPVADQTELIDQLRRNRHWVALLAEEVKALRLPRLNRPGQVAS